MKEKPSQFENQEPSRQPMTSEQRESLAKEILSHKDEIREYVNSVIGKLFDAKVDEVTDEVLSRASLRVDQLEDPTALKGWLKRIAVNLANDEYRRLLKSRLQYGEVTEDSIDPAPDPERQFLEQERTSAIRSVMKKLSDREKLVVELHYFQDLTVAEIVKKTGLNINTVKSDLVRAREKLFKPLKALEKR